MVELLELLETARAGELLSEAASRSKYIPHFVDALATKPPRRVEAIVSLQGNGRHTEDWSRLLVIARFTSPHSPIEAVARSLAKAVLEAGIVPLIVPLNVREFETMTWDTPIVRRIATRSAVLFRSKHGD